MNKIALALASTAIAAAASSTFITSAEAGGRGGRFHFGFRHFGHHHHFRHFHAPSPSYEDFYERRRKPKVVVKYITKSVPKATVAKATPAKATTAAAAKTEDSQGRMFDPVSKTWFDGKGQCWKGDKAFAYRSGSWFYGNARWVETTSGWGVTSGTLPGQVSCDGIQAFSGRIQQAQTTPAPAQPKTTQTQAPAEPPAQVANAPAPAPAPEPQATTTTPAPAAPATARECKKYFPSVGEMVTVPCTE
jgi:hypothetical protein